MKSLFITFAFALFLSTTLNAQPPIEYTVARRDTILQQNQTVPGSVWSTGMGTKWCNPDYNGLCIWRLTDASVFPGGATVQTPDNDADAPAIQTTPNQKDNIISGFNGSKRYIIARSTGGGSAIIAFDQANSKAITVPSRPPGEMMFDETNPGIIYARVNHTKIKKYTSKDGWQHYTQDDIYDFANCLPQGCGKSRRL